MKEIQFVRQKEFRDKTVCLLQVCNFALIKRNMTGVEMTGLKTVPSFHSKNEIRSLRYLCITSSLYPYNQVDSNEMHGSQDSRACFKETVLVYHDSLSSLCLW